MIFHDGNLRNNPGLKETRDRRAFLTTGTRRHGERRMRLKPTKRLEK